MWGHSQTTTDPGFAVSPRSGAKASIDLSKNPSAPGIMIDMHVTPSRIDSSHAQLYMQFFS